MRNLLQGHLRGKKSRGGARERILATANVLLSKLVLRFESEIAHADSLFFFFFESLFPRWLVISWETLELLELSWWK